MAAALNLDQQRAVAMANARMRMAQDQGGNSVPAPSTGGAVALLQDMGLPDSFSQSAGTALNQAGRTAGLTARNLVQGVTSFPAMAMNAEAGLYNTAANAIQGKDKGFRFRNAQDNISGALDEVGLPAPATPGERVGSDIAQGIAGAGTGVGLGKALTAAPGQIARGVGNVLSQSPGEQAILGGASGYAAGTAREQGATPTGQLLAGMSLPLLMMTGKAAGAAALNRVMPKAAATAGQRIADAATDAASLPDKLDNVQSIVPGSMPTTFQATGDSGLGMLQQQVSRQSPAPFVERAQQQNAARLEQLANVQPGGDPSDLTGFLKGKLADIDQQMADAHTAAVQQAQLAAQQLGGTGTADSYGAGLRGALSQANTAARTSERALWRAVDPDNTLTVNGSPIQQAAQQIQARITPSSQQPSAAEQAIYNAAQGYGPTVPFGDVGDLRSNISAQMRQELRTAGQSPAFARLAQMRGAVEDAIQNSAQGAAADQAASTGQTSEDVIRGWQNRWYQQQQNAGAANSIGGGYDATVGPGSISTARGGPGQNGGQPGSVAGDQGIQGQPFDSDAAQRLSLATAATKQRAQTFGQPPLSNLLRTTGNAGQYRMPDGAVPSAVFQPGPKGFNSVTAFTQAVGPDNAVTTLQDYAASQLRKTATTPDGTLDPGKVSSWLNRHSDALRAIPGLAGKFQTAASTSDAIGEAAAARRIALDQYNTGALGKITGLGAGDNVPKVVGNILASPSGASQIQQIASHVAGDPNAMEGLRSAIVQNIQQRFITGQGENAAIRANAFQQFMSQNQPALRSVFSKDQLDGMTAIAADLQRSNLPTLPGAIPEQKSVFGRLAAEVGGALAGHAAVPLVGPFLGWLGVKTTNALRDAGINRVDDLVQQAMLHPDIARALLQKAGQKPSQTALEKLASSLGRANVFGLSAPISTSYQKQQGNAVPLIMPQLMPNAPAPVSTAQPSLGSAVPTRPAYPVPDSSHFTKLQHELPG